MPQRLARRLLIIGWDAADWHMIDPLLARGLMPNLAKLVQRGVRADLSTLEPKLSPMLWTSIATGKTADKHGILSFIEPDPQGAGVRISSSTSRKTKALWNMLTQSNMTVNVIGWYATHPAEPINGVCISNLFQDGAPEAARHPWPALNGAVHPHALATRIASLRVHPNALADRDLMPLIPKLKHVPRSSELLRSLRVHLAQNQSIHRVALSLLNDAKSRADCTMVFFDGIDTIGHHFMEFHPPRMAHVSLQEFEWFKDVMDGVYQMFDRMLGEQLTALGGAGDETTVMLLSDHGFYSDHLRPVTRNLAKEDRAALEAAWHRATGVLVMAGEPFRRGEKSAGAGLLDIVPTALTVFGLPVGRDMDGRVLTETFSSEVALESIESWDAREGEAGLHPPEARQDPFEARDAIQQLIDLGYLAALPEGEQAKVDLTRRESDFNLGVVYLSTQRPALASPIFAELVREKPDESRYVLNMARCHLMLARIDDAIALLREYLQRQPDHVEARLLLAGALATGRHSAEATAELVQIEQRCQEREDIPLTIGEIWALLHQWDRAVVCYRRVLAVDPKNVTAHLGLARAALVAQAFDRAVEHCLDALEIQFSSAQAHHLLGTALAWLNDLPHAIESFQHALKVAPGMVDTHQFLEAIFERTGDTARAAEHRRAWEALLNRQAAAVVPMRDQEDPLGVIHWRQASSEKV